MGGLARNGPECRQLMLKSKPNHYSHSPALADPTIRWLRRRCHIILLHTGSHEHGPPALSPLLLSSSNTRSTRSCRTVGTWTLIGLPGMRRTPCRHSYAWYFGCDGKCTTRSMSCSNHFTPLCSKKYCKLSPQGCSVRPRPMNTSLPIRGTIPASSGPWFWILASAMSVISKTSLTP